MKLNLPDEIMQRAEVTVQELRLSLAIQLYADRRLDYDDACQLAEVVPAIMNRELIGRDLSVLIYPKVELLQRRQAG